MCYSVSAGVAALVNDAVVVDICGSTFVVGIALVPDSAIDIFVVTFVIGAALDVYIFVVVVVVDIIGSVVLAVTTGAFLLMM